jgi:hypothetical protein
VGEEPVPERTPPRAWFSLSSGSTAALHAVDFTSDGVRGLAVGSGGVAYRTLDGGATWASSSTGTTANLLSVSVPATGTGQVAYACGSGGTILRTDDFGASWTAQPAPATTLRAILFPGGDTFGYCVGDGSTVLQTSTGGLVWNAQSPPAADYHAVSAPFTGQTAFIGGTGGGVAITESGGALWTARPVGVSSTVRALASPTGSRGKGGAEQDARKDEGFKVEELYAVAEEALKKDSRAEDWRPKLRALVHRFAGLIIPDVPKRALPDLQSALPLLEGQLPVVREHKEPVQDALIVVENAEGKGTSQRVLIVCRSYTAARVTNAIIVCLGDMQGNEVRDAVVFVQGKVNLSKGFDECAVYAGGAVTCGGDVEDNAIVAPAGVSCGNAKGNVFINTSAWKTELDRGENREVTRKDLPGRAGKK